MPADDGRSEMDWEKEKSTLYTLYLHWTPSPSSSSTAAAVELYEVLNDVHLLIHSKHYHHHHLPIRRTLQRSYRHSNWYRLSVPGTLRPPDSATASIIDAPFLIINNLIELTAEQSRAESEQPNKWHNRCSLRSVLCFYVCARRTICQCQKGEKESRCWPAAFLVG